MPAKNTRSMRSTKRDGTPAEDRDLSDDLEAAENRLAARKLKQSPSKAVSDPMLQAVPHRGAGSETLLPLC